jgi:hypothetical protein
MNNKIKIIGFCFFVSLCASFFLFKSQPSIDKLKTDSNFRQNYLRYSYAYRNHSTGECVTTFCKHINMNDKPEKIMRQIDESLTKAAYCLWVYAISNKMEDKPVSEIKEKINCDN